MYLFVIGNFFRRRRPRRATDEMPAGPLLEALLFIVLFGTAALLGSVAFVAAVGGSILIPIACGCASAICLFGAIVFWMRLNH